jgi:GntR family transcriptional regulator, colanic acid and biofilm gene transcriptional regulator
MQTAIQPAMQHVEHVSLATQVLREIRSAIVLGDLAPGARLTFRDVAQRLNASVTPVREALLQLVAERVLSVGPGRTITLPMLTRAQFLELRVVRIVLEGLAAEAAARQSGAALADELQAIHCRLDEAKRARDARQATIQNRAFHFRLYEAAALPALLGMIENIWLRTGPYHRYIFADATRYIFDTPVPSHGVTLHCHSHIIEALRRGRPTEVRRAVEADILSGDAVILPQLPLDSPEQLECLARSLPSLRTLPAELLQSATDLTLALPIAPSRPERRKRRSVRAG